MIATISFSSTYELSFVDRHLLLQYLIARKKKKKKERKSLIAKIIADKVRSKLSQSLGDFHLEVLLSLTRSFPPLKKARWKKVSCEEVRGRLKNNSTERCGEEKSRRGHKFAGARKESRNTIVVGATTCPGTKNERAKRTKLLQFAFLMLG